MLKKIFYLATVIVGIYLIINLGRTITSLWQKQEEVTRAWRELEVLKKENKDLQAQLEYLKTPEFLEREAREKLGLVLPGEKQVLIAEELLGATPEGQLSRATRQNWWTNWEKWLKLFF